MERFFGVPFRLRPTVLISAFLSSIALLARTLFDRRRASIPSLGAMVFTRPQALQALWACMARTLVDRWLRVDWAIDRRVRLFRGTRAAATSRVWQLLASEVLELYFRFTWSMFHRVDTWRFTMWGSDPSARDPSEPDCIMYDDDVDEADDDTMGV